MTLGVIARAMQAGLAKLGEPSLLDGVNIGPVNIERGVDVFVGDPGRSDDNSVAQADVATLPRVSGARTGQVLVHPDGTFKLTRKLEDNGYSVMYVIVPYVP